VRRRTLIAGVGTAASVLLLSGQSIFAQARKVARIGYLGNTRGTHQPLLDGLQERGWEPGSFVIEARWSQGRVERLPELAAELAALNMDVIVAASPPAVRAAQQATRTIPIIMFAVANPVEAGFIASLSNPGGNITGVTSTPGSLFSKVLEITKEAIPSASRIGMLYNAGNPLNYASADHKDISAASDALSLQRIHDLAEKYGVPMIWGPREYLDGRGLLSYGPSLNTQLRQAAGFVDRVLRGAPPATMPVEQPTTYQLVLSLKTARELGLTIPPTVIARADEVIE
jgi:putative tryptophan/tyrosine transport system substrate-binding protein